jgi:hypothetical protein
LLDADPVQFVDPVMSGLLSAQGDMVEVDGFQGHLEQLGLTGLGLPFRIGEPRQYVAAVAARRELA